MEKMPMFGRRLLKVLLPAFLCMLPAFVHAAEQKDYTVMIYMCGSDLETEGGCATEDILEMMDLEFDPQELNLLMMTGGAKYWHVSFPSDSNWISGFQEPYAFPEKIDDKLFASMGEADTLAYFLQYGISAYPAERYALILWDHGEGPLGGACLDEIFDPDRLSLDELAEALKKASLPYKLEWIGFDACLMSSVEVASRLSPYANYMVASQAEEPGSGWNYGFLEGICEDENGGETGKRIVEAYFEVPQETNRDLTMACIDLSAIRQVEEAMDNMYGQMAESLSPTTFSDLANLRFEATGFGKAGVPESESNGYDLVDIVSLSDSYSAMSEKEAELVREAVQNAVVYQRSNVAGSSGLSVYHPFRNQDKFKDEWKNAYSRLGFCPGYADYVDIYGKIMAGLKLASWSDLTHILAEEEGEGAYVTLELTDEQMANMASARLLVLARNFYDEADDAFFQVFSTAKVENFPGGIAAHYDGSTLQVFNAGGFAPLTGALSYRVTEEGNYVLRFYPVDEDGNREPYPVLAEYTMDERGQLILKAYSFYDELLGNYTQRISRDLSGYRGITFLNTYRNVTVNEEGEHPAFDEWEEDLHQDAGWRARYDIARTDFMPVFSQELSRAEELYAVFEITDTQGNRYTSEIAPLSSGRASYSGLSFEEPEEPLEPYEVSGHVMVRPAKASENAEIIFNVAVSNQGDKDIRFWLRHVSVNGMLLEGSFAGAGGNSDASGTRQGLSFGETGAASVRLRYEDILPILPDAALSVLSCDLEIYQSGEKGELLVRRPLRAELDISLAHLCQDTKVLPSRAVVEAGRENGAFDAGKEKLLFVHDGVSLYMQGFFITKGNVVLLLRGENLSEREYRVSLGEAAMDGEKARLGESRTSYVDARNTRVRTYGAEKETWETDTGTGMKLAPGESSCFFVSVRSEDEGHKALGTLSFHAILYPVENPLEVVYLDAVEIGIEGSLPLLPGMEAVVPVEDFAVSGGEAIEGPEDKKMVDDKIAVPEEGAPAPLHLTLYAEEGMTINRGYYAVFQRIPSETARGYYAVFQRIPSETALVEMNMINPLLSDTKKPAVSFEKGQEWMRYVAFGALATAEDGRSAEALFPCVYTAAKNMGESLPLGVSDIRMGEDGKFYINQTQKGTFFYATKYPDTFVGYTGNINIVYDPEANEAALLSCLQRPGNHEELAGILLEEVSLLPLSIDPARLIDYLLGEKLPEEATVYGVQLLSGLPITAAVESIRDIDDYVIFFVYSDTDDAFHAAKYKANGEGSR